MRKGSQEKQNGKGKPFKMEKLWWSEWVLLVSFLSLICHYIFICISQVLLSEHIHFNFLGIIGVLGWNGQWTLRQIFSSTLMRSHHFRMRFVYLLLLKQFNFIFIFNMEFKIVPWKYLINEYPFIYPNTYLHRLSFYTEPRILLFSSFMRITNEFLLIAETWPSISWKKET